MRRVHDPTHARGQPVARRPSLGCFEEAITGLMPRVPRHDAGWRQWNH